MSNRYESADLILKLYELRRDETMRKARNWFMAFSPASVEDIVKVMTGEHNAYYRMVTSYWDMAATFVNQDAIDEEMFNDTNREHMAVFCKLEPYIEELRAVFKEPKYLSNLEQVVMRMPNAKEYLALMRKRMKTLAAANELAAKNEGDE